MTGSTLRKAPPASPLERALAKLLREPPSVRLAAAAIVATTTAIVIGSGILMRAFDHHEYPNIWVGMWWALQTVTTVGYGDVTPKAPVGRAVAAVVMLEGIAFLAIITAAIASGFVTRAERERALVEDAAEAAFEARIDARLDELNGRFDRLESMLGDRGSQ